MITGFTLGNIKKIKIKKLSKIGSKLGDPLTIKIHRWSRKYKLSFIKNRKWLLLFISIFLNNLILAAFVSKILYGVIFFIPLFAIAWTGFGQGVILTKSESRAGIVLMIFEFGGYLFATVIGVRFGVNILFSLITKSKLIIDIPRNYLILMLLFIALGAFVETLSMKMAGENIDFSNIDKIDLDQKRKDIADQLDKN